MWRATHAKKELGALANSTAAHQTLAAVYAAHPSDQDASRGPRDRTSAAR